jgi:hypothetical protein
MTVSYTLIRNTQNNYTIIVPIILSHNAVQRVFLIAFIQLNNGEDWGALVAYVHRTSGNKDHDEVSDLSSSTYGRRRLHIQPRQSVVYILTRVNG